MECYWTSGYGIVLELKFHAFRKVSFSFAECICNLIVYCSDDSSAEGQHHFKRLL